MNRFSNTDKLLGLLGIGIIIYFIFREVKMPQISSESQNKTESEKVVEDSEKPLAQNNTFYGDASTTTTYFSILYLDGTTSKPEEITDFRYWLVEDPKGDLSIKILSKKTNAYLINCNVKFTERINGKKVYDGDSYPKGGGFLEVTLNSMTDNIELSDIARGVEGAWGVSWFINANRDKSYCLVINPINWK